MTSTMTAAQGIAAKEAGQAAVPHLHLTPEIFLVLVGVVLLALVVYRISLVLFPHKMCRRCGGSGKIRGWFGSVTFCHKCDGRGAVPRLGTLMTGGAGRGRAR